MDNNFTNSDNCSIKTFHKNSNKIDEFQNIMDKKKMKIKIQEKIV